MDKGKMKSFTKNQIEILKRLVNGEEITRFWGYFGYYKLKGSKRKVDVRTINRLFKERYVTLKAAESPRTLVVG